MQHHEKILIIDFGSQVTQLIARRVREEGVYCEIHPYNKVSASLLEDFKPKAIILSGGPSSVGKHGSPRIGMDVFEYGVPILGICYGQQLMCDLLGGKVESSDHREFGKAFVTVERESPLFKDVWKLHSIQQVWMSHGDRVIALPQGFSVIATTQHAPFAAVADESRHFYGVQFHPEVTHTPAGAKLIHNFVRNVANCKGDWTMQAFLQQAIDDIRKKVGKGKVIAGVSGGVDSSVVALLLHKALGDQVTCIFVDHGLLRKDESQQVEEMFVRLGHVPLIRRDAKRLFLDRLKGISDPEQKRKIIGKTFIDIFEEEAKKVEGATFLAQGTLYPDVIESISVHGDASVTIKSHHNVGGLPDRMNLSLIEPVRELFKDEVRALGRELGMPDEMVGRHPFPGPGLAIRVLGEITEEKLEILRNADAAYISEIRNAGLYDVIWQAFAVLLPVQTVGVMGDARTYEYVCGLRAVTSVDGMTAEAYYFEMSFLEKVANRIINTVKGVNRVVYDITSKPPGTIEWE
ncbi:MAG: glutamine-hydrolyzing GMP synthase [Alphaproteobacteria bacterium]|nr:glutamine-hydrolyzing GMP synthase [Alphaproteobacteria bacterium]